MKVHVIRFLYNLYIEVAGDDIETGHVRSLYYFILVDLNSRYMLEELNIFSADDLEDFLTIYEKAYDR